MNDLKNTVLTLLGPKKRIAAIGLVCMMVLGSLFEVVGIASIPAFISLLENPELVQQYEWLEYIYTFSGVESPSDFLLYAAIGLIIVFILKNTYLGVLSIARARFIFNTQHQVGVRLFDGYLHRPYTFHLKHNSAELIRNVKENASLVVTAFLLAFLTIVMQILNVVCIFILLLVVEPVLSFVSMSVLGGVSFGFLMLIRKKTAKYGKIEQEEHQAMIQAISQGLGGLKESLVLGRQGYFLKAFSSSSRRFANACKFRQVMQEIPQRFIETIAVIGMLLIAVTFLARGGSMEGVVPILALFGVAVVKLMPSMKVLVSSFHAIQFYQYAVDNVCNELDEHRKEAVASGSKRGEEQPSFVDSLTFKNVVFSYPDAKIAALKNISLQIPKGSTVGFVGSSGAGKTTLVDLLLGILTPTSGKLLVDGRDVQNHLKGWQSRLGYIPQSIYLCDDSIAKNIALGIEDDEIDIEQVYKVAEIAQLDQFVHSLPNGFDTIIGEGGVRLSGGQRQRIGIARALYHEPEVLVMDEATSALDNQTEKFFMEALSRLREKYTIIMIAHRLSTVKECDTLFMMENGRVTETGSYRKLIKESTTFRGMAAVA